MSMTTDGELLGRYSEENSEESFGELVRRHVDLVYSAALRQVNGNAPLAQDIAQAVFSDLARKARTLQNRSTLAGWLYTSTHHAAANAIRSEQRRQTHEQEAHAMQELLRNPGPELDWESFRPLLDDAMQQLNEGDREVILLRYFQNRTYPDIGEQMGVGENGARMRAERALEKLRRVLSQRGLTTTGAVATMLSTHAVIAAPAGLAGTITTTATLAGSAAVAAATTSTTTIAAKTITMTTLSKALSAVVIAASVGTAVYASRRASRLSNENQVLKQQQTALASQVQGLQQQQGEASNRLTSLAEENQRLTSEQNTSELLKLRSQVTALRQAASSAGGKPSSTMVAKMLNDPKMLEYVHQYMLRGIKDRYAPFIKELHLSPEDADRFTSLVGDIYLKGTQMAYSGAPTDSGQLRTAFTNAVADQTSQLKALLGEQGFAQLEDYTKTIPGRALVQLLNQQLTDNGLTDAESSQLVQIVTALPPSSTRGIAGDFNPAFLGSQETVDAHLQQVMDSNQHILDQSASFLTTNQLSTLAMVLSNSVNAQKVQGEALRLRP